MKQRQRIYYSDEQKLLSGIVGKKVIPCMILLKYSIEDTLQFHIYCLKLAELDRLKEYGPVVHSRLLNVKKSLEELLVKNLYVLLPID